MPPQSTVRMRGVDGTLWDIPTDKVDMAKQRGAVVVDAPAGPGPVKRAATSFLGLPEDINLTDTSGFAKVGTYLDALKQAATGLFTGSSTAAASGLARMRQPGLASKLAGGTEYAISGIPLVGPATVTSMEQAGRGDYAGSAGSAASAILMGKGLAKGGPALTENIAARLNEGTRPILQSYWGVGRTATQLEAERQVDVLKKTRADNQLAVNTARTNYQVAEAQAIKDATDVNKKALLDARTKYEAEEAAAERREHLLHGAELTSQSIADRLPEVRDEAVKVAKSLYPEVGGTVDAEEIAREMQGIIDQKLYGVGRVPPTLGRILNEAAPKGPAGPGAAMMDTSAGLTSLPWDFNKLHGVYSELGREMLSNLPGDERAADAMAYDYFGKKMRSLAAAEGKTARFDIAQKNWRDMQNTFFNTDPVSQGGSPLARVLRAMDPITGKLRPEFVQDALSDDTEYKYARRMLAPYPDLVDKLDTMKHAMDSARDLPKRAPTSATVTGTMKVKEAESASITGTTVPEVPEAMDRLAWREDVLKKVARNLSGAPGQFAATPYRIRYVPIPRTLAKWLANPENRAWLAQDPAAMKTLADKGWINMLYVPRVDEQNSQHPDAAGGE